jgi:hypothetical protein
MDTSKTNRQNALWSNDLEHSRVFGWVFGTISATGHPCSVT